MTQEEKAKAYDEAIKRAKALYDSHQPISGNNVIIDNIFPELRKSEDEYLEKIKKDIISYLNNRKIDTIPESSATEKWIDWLEKQKLTKNINKEDEEVRQYLIRTMKQKDINVPMVQKALAWLEKQGVQKSLDDVAKEVTKNKETAMSFLKFCGIMNANGELADEYKIEQGEQKSADSYCQENCKGFQETRKCFADWDCKDKRESESIDKIEPKFKVGDWIVENGVNRNPVQIISFEEDKGSGIKVWFSNSTGTYIDFLKGYHKWTIQDAKDGDVLASELCDSIILFKGIKDGNIDFYCDYDFSKIDIPGDRFAVNNGQHYGNVEDSKDFHPATKEQRDLLFSKMKEAGYMLDEETHMLKKIETRPMLSDFFKAEYERGKADAISEVQKEWTEDDKNHMANILNMLLMEAKNAKVEQYKSCVESDIDWIYSLKNKSRVQPKQEWSEDDEKILNKIIQDYEAASKSFCGHQGKLEWLKSLRQRIGG